MLHKKRQPRTLDKLIKYIKIAIKALDKHSIQRLAVKIWKTDVK